LKVAKNKWRYKMEKLKIMALVILITVLALPAMHACKQAAEAPPAAPAKEVKVAIITDLTGPNAAYIAPAFEGSKAYFEWQNEEKGGIDGVLLDITTYDNSGSMPKSYEAVQRAIDDGAILFFSNSATVTEPTIKLAEANKIPHVTVSPGLKGLWTDWLYAMVISTIGDTYPSLLDAILALWEKEGKPGKPKVGVLTHDAMTGHIAHRGFLDPCEGTEVFYIEQKGVEYVKEMFPQTSTDLTAQIAKLKDAGVDEIIFGGTVGPNVAALKAMSLVNWDPSHLFVGVLVSASDLIAQAPSELVENVHIQTAVWSGLTDPDLDPPGMALVRELWEEKNPGKPIADLFVTGVVEAMVCSDALRLALEKVAPEELTGETIREHGLNRVTDYNAGGLLGGPVTWRAGVGNHDGPCSWFVWQYRGGYNYLDHKVEPCPYVKCK
jgi:branched-chain amino acid transport system substrate-binding protein